MEHEVVTEPRREVQLREVISHLLTVLDPLAAWYLLTRTSRKSMTLRAQGQAVDGPDDVVSFTCTRRSSTSLSKIIPTDIRDLGCSRVAWPEQRPPALRSSSSAAPAMHELSQPFFSPQGRSGSNRMRPREIKHKKTTAPAASSLPHSGPPPAPRRQRCPTGRHVKPPWAAFERRIQPSTPQGDSRTASGALPAPNRSC